MTENYQVRDFEAKALHGWQTENIKKAAVGRESSVTPSEDFYAEKQKCHKFNGCKTCKEFIKDQEGDV